MVHSTSLILQHYLQLLQKSIQLSRHVTKREYFSLNVCGAEPKKTWMVLAVMFVTTYI